MDQIIRERVKVDERGAVVLIDGRLRPGEEVDVTVRPVDLSTDGSLLKTARSIDLNAPTGPLLGSGLDINVLPLPLDDLAHCRVVDSRFPRDGCHRVAVFQTRLVDRRIARALVLSHAGRKQALQSGPVR